MNDVFLWKDRELFTKVMKPIQTETSITAKHSHQSKNINRNLKKHWEESCLIRDFQLWYLNSEKSKSRAIKINLLKVFCHFWSHIDIVEKLHVFLTFFQNHFNRELCTTSPVLMFDIQLLMHTTNIDILLILIMRAFSCEVGAKAGCKPPSSPLRLVGFGGFTSNWVKTG